MCDAINIHIFPYVTIRHKEPISFKLLISNFTSQIEHHLILIKFISKYSISKCFLQRDHNFLLKYIFPAKLKFLSTPSLIKHGHKWKRKRQLHAFGNQAGLAEEHKESKNKTILVTCALSILLANSFWRNKCQYNVIN